VLSAITTFSACLRRLFGMWLYVVCNIIFALELFHDYIYQDMKKNEAYDGRVMDLPLCVRA
jgi:hypothetical protein